MTESDDVDNMTEGKYVYWMGIDDDIPRGHLGEIVEVLDEPYRRIKFPQGTWKLKAHHLNVSDFQKRTFVHCPGGDYDFEVIGEILDLDEGELIVEIMGEKVKKPPKKLVKCDFQPGMYVFWTKSDDDIPPGHMGTVLPDLNEEGMVKVKFPNGAWRFTPKQMVRGHIQHGSYVQWTKHDEDIAKGEIGQVFGELNDEGKVKVKFAKGCWRFDPESLFLHEMQLGCFVTWSKHDDDVEKGAVGHVIGIKVDQGRLRVQFPKGRWTFKANMLKLHKVQPGMLVHWACSDEDIPRGDIGEVVRMKDERNRMGVMWPKGNFSIKPKELRMLPFQKGDRVQWTSADDDIPEGDLGIVMGISYEDDGSGNRLMVKWTKGRWAMKPEGLKATNLDADSINQLKAAFKRFDKNGDGKLTVEELKGVLGKLGDGGLSDDECQQLFDGLDKDSDGKLTSNEFIDYIFGGEASGSQRKLLGEGFGLDDLVGIGGDDSDEEEDDDNENNNSGGSGNVIVSPTPAVISDDPAVMEGIGADTSVSRAEWASALLFLGVCRQAGLDSFDSCLAVTGQEGDLTLESLAAELNGTGGVPGVEELRKAVGKVKCGTVSTVDLESPAAESDYERELAMKTGIDGLLYHLCVQNKPLDDAAGELESAKLSTLESAVLGSMDGDALVEAAKAQAADPPVISVLSSWQRAREHCQKEVNAIIEACRGSGEKYTDPSFNPLEDDGKAMLWVDREEPGYNSTVGKPGSWLRAQETGNDYQLYKEGGNFNDVEQGNTGDCFLLGAMAGMAANRKGFFHQVFVAYDLEVGVFGVLMCKDSHFTYEIVDDFLAVTDHKGIVYGRSRERSELWVSIVEKAFFKHYTCVEMCDGGHGTEATFSFLGGLTGRYAIGDQEFDHPDKFFEKMKNALASGELMTTAFRQPSKGKYADMAGGGEDGQCGEKSLPFGLHGGHCYTVLRLVEVDGHQLCCLRNPWGKGEWLGPWGDKSEEWNDERRQAAGATNETDGTFFMDVQDYVQLSGDTKFIRTFGPAWQTVRCYSRFSDTPMKARAKKKYEGQDDFELSFDKGDIIDVIEVQGFWIQGTLQRTGETGFFRNQDAEIKTDSVFLFEFSAEGMAEGAPLILGMLRENQKLCREWVRRKEDGKNAKVWRYDKGYWFIFDGEGTKVTTGRFNSRHIWRYLDPNKGPYSIYISCPAGKGKRFSMQGYAPHGSMKLKQLECSYADFLDKCA